MVSSPATPPTHGDDRSDGRAVMLCVYVPHAGHFELFQTSVERKPVDNPATYHQMAYSA
jgi:hypothetical protein